MLGAGGTATTVAAQKRPKPADMPVHSYFLDQDANAVPYTLQGDGLGAYTNGTANVISVLMGNVYNNLYNGDWEMDASASTMRTVAVTLSLDNAVPAGSPGYTVAPNPPFWGKGFEAARVFDACTKYNKDVLTMQAGTSITCELLVRWDDGGTSYRLDMGTPLEAPESTAAQISCNGVDGVGCTDWYIDPIPVINGDGSVSPGRSIARLVSIARNGSVTNLGDFYMTYHFHVTRP
jgi:hypothetical protein